MLSCNLSDTLSHVQRIVSFLPSATEMVCALGLEDSLVGVTHECDYPPAVRNKPVVVRNVLPIEHMTQAEIDVAVAERMGRGESLYQIDEQLLKQLAPDLILTQNLCQVCAPSGNEVSQVLRALPHTPQVLWLTPQSVSEIFDNLRDLGAATGCEERARQISEGWQTRLDALRNQIATTSTRPRVFCMEWLDPIYASGHWVPELVSAAGGIDSLARSGADSVRISWEELAAWAPEVLVIMPCGFNLEQTMKQIRDVFGPDGSLAAKHRAQLFDLPAAHSNRIYAVDANSYFARPGPRVVEGSELLASLFHPELFTYSPRANNSAQQVDVSLLRG